MVVIKNVGDSAIAIVFGDKIDERINMKVNAVAEAIERDFENIEVVPTYTSVYIYYNPVEISYIKLISDLKSYLSIEPREITKNVVEIPVAYGDEFGPDLEYVAEYNSLSEEDVIKIHSGVLYRVYMLGFIPGFAYLGGMRKDISTPRMKTPRLKVPAGSVGIAEDQTGWYSIESPGGWRIIGRTPLKTFNLKNNPPAIVSPGEYVRFRVIDGAEFYRIYEKEWGDEYY